MSTIGLQPVPSLLLQAHGPLEAAQIEVARLQMRYLGYHQAHAHAKAAPCASHCISALMHAIEPSKVLQSV